MLDQSAAHDRIRFEVGQRVEQRLLSAALVELTDCFGANGIIRFQQAQEITRSIWSKDLHDASRSGLAVALVHVSHLGQPNTSIIRSQTSACISPGSPASSRAVLTNREAQEPRGAALSVRGVGDFGASSPDGQQASP
jgi:hypothetical protein